jgi:hypothetical protein
MATSARQLGLGTIAALVLAALGIIVPIGWDQYKNKASIQFRLIGMSTVVSPVSGVEKVQLAYDGRSVANVSKIDIVLSNTGRTPIRQADIVVPPQVQLLDGDVLDVRLQSVRPLGVEATFAADTGARAVSVLFPLLNPGDVVSFSILASTVTPRVRFGGRIAGVPAIAFRDDRTSVPGQRRSFGWTFYVVGVVSLFVLGLLLTMIWMLGTEHQIQSLWARGVIQIPQVEKASEMLAYIEKGFADDKVQELAPLKGYLRGLPNDRSLTDAERATIARQFNAAFTNVKLVWASIVSLTILVATGLGYVATVLF